MGLDMYLTAHRYLSQHDADTKEIADKVTEADGIPSDRFHAKRIQYEAMYWRKANAIHGWFVRNVQNNEDDCREYDVSRDDLVMLVGVCNHVIQNHDLAEELLPVTEGFFFGSYEYDDWYYDDIAKTIEGINEVLKTFDNSYWFTYQSSW